MSLPFPPELISSTQNLCLRPATSTAMLLSNFFRKNSGVASKIARLMHDWRVKPKESKN